MPEVRPPRMQLAAVKNPPVMPVAAQNQPGRVEIPAKFKAPPVVDRSPPPQPLGKQRLRGPPRGSVASSTQPPSAPTQRESPRGLPQASVSSCLSSLPRPPRPPGLPPNHAAKMASAAASSQAERRPQPKTPTGPPKRDVAKTPDVEASSQLPDHRATAPLRESAEASSQADRLPQTTPHSGPPPKIVATTPAAEASSQAERQPEPKPPSGPQPETKPQEEEPEANTPRDGSHGGVGGSSAPSDADAPDNEEAVDGGEPFWSRLMEAINTQQWVEAWEWLDFVSEEEVCMLSPATAKVVNHTALHLAAWAPRKHQPYWVGTFFELLCEKAA